MQIVIHCGGLPFNGQTIPSGESLGGSESAAYFMARELAALGHRVICFTNSPDMGKFDEVNYQFIGKCDQNNPMGENFHTVLQVPHDVVVAQRHPMAFIRPLNSKLNIWWLHDLALIRNGGIVNHHLPYIDQVLTVSEFHKKQVVEYWDIPERLITPTWNGVDYTLFPPVRSIEDRQPRSLVFAARPERGLEEIIRPETGLAEIMPDYHFHVCTYKNVPDHIRGFYEFCWKRCAELPNVTNHGFLGKRELYELIGRSMLYIYPTSFEDTSNIMILESNAVGTPFVGLNDHAALPETGKDGGCYWVDMEGAYQYGVHDKTNLTDPDLVRFADKIKYLCENESKWKQLKEKALGKKQDWKSAALQWDGLFKNMLAQKCDDKRRLFKHLEHYSDVHIIKDAAREQLEDDYHFMYSGDYKTHYDNYYQYEEDRGVKYGPEDLSGNPRFEHTFTILEGLVKAFAANNVPFQNVLDYGCAHGHYVMNLAKRFPSLDYTGVDINRKNVTIANDWKRSAQLDSRITFYCGETENLKDLQYDLIIVAEVLEHVPNPVELCEQLKKHLSPNGYMLITVPYGAWEAIGYKEHPGWRAHIHQLERTDLEEIFGAQKGFNLQGLPHSANLGHYFVTFENSAEPLGEINIKRKLAEQSPQETVSACLIVKDGENSLGRTLDSIEGLYDELIIGVDETTSDDTWKICEKYNAQYFKMKTPVGKDGIGFAEARNLTIERASMDWIFWIDSDEVLENGENLKKYLRHNCFDAYGIKQHHFAVEPEGILKTDFPARLFRNHRGFKFFGHVHEHPEIKEINNGPGKVYIISDVAIMHNGYATEARRRKRFERNFPLMEIDHKKNPERQLGKFLWMRDLAHLCKYTMERNGVQVTPEIRGWAQEGIEIYREMMSAEKPSARLLVDGVLYQNELSQIICNGSAIEFTFDYNTAKGAPIKSKIPIHGYFSSGRDIIKLAEVLINESTKYYEDRYF
jgi:2-polyprenyl-3-methyl-5-hydroxy-6-metoxy-1,4-benzoquinol methylase/glycosyltransferase involved in cell wall biosynthesis